MGAGVGESESVSRSVVSDSATPWTAAHHVVLFLNFQLLIEVDCASLILHRGLASKDSRQVQRIQSTETCPEGRGADQKLPGAGPRTRPRTTGGDPLHPPESHSPTPPRPSEHAQFPEEPEVISAEQRVHSEEKVLVSLVTALCVLRASRPQTGVSERLPVS